MYLHSAIILVLISGIILIASIIEISSNDENPTSGPIAMTDGCCYGGFVQIVGLYFILDNQNEVELIPPKD